MLDMAKKGPNMKQYKLRSECQGDILNLIAVAENHGNYLCINSIIRHNDLPDCEFTFQTQYTLGDMRELCGLVPDGHVMAETVELEHNYTGTRKDAL